MCTTLCYKVSVTCDRSVYCNKLYKSFCFWGWNRNEKQKYNTDINICTYKSGPFIHETGSGTCKYPVSVRKNWLLVKIIHCMVLMMWFPFHLIPSDSDSCQPVPKSFQSQTENSSYQGFVFVSGPFIHETGSGTCKYPVSVRKNWLLVKILAGS
jgi:hypothetical protein